MDLKIFLSASVPDPNRNPTYLATANVTAIGEAVRALAAVTLPGGELVFGGHPAISPLVYVIARQLNAIDGVVIYQSEFYRAVIPPTSLALSRITWTAADPRGKAPSLDRMRRDMIHSRDFDFGVFIGGMEGVEEEYRMFRAAHPAKPFVPLASTGAAAKIIYQKDLLEIDPRYRAALETDFVYGQLFKEVLGIN